MVPHVVFLSIPGLRQQDLDRMPNLGALTAEGDLATLTPSFPCVTWPVQANMLTGCRANQHGIVANGLYWREQQRVEMWTAWNDKILRPQVWDMLHQRDPQISSAVWFPMLSRACGADYVCMPAPIHNPDGSEDLWCYTKPETFYGTLRDELGHFPLQNFWGPLANIRATDWIADSACLAAKEFSPRLFYLYLPHLDYAAQKSGPDSAEAIRAVVELDRVIGRLAESLYSTVDKQAACWLVASEYTIGPVDHVEYPNRLLREAGLLQVVQQEDGEHLDLSNSQAWALVDHQFSHVFVEDKNPAVVARVTQLFQNREGIAEVLVGDQLAKYSLDHERSGEVILVSTSNSWQAYYWWFDDQRAPGFAVKVDIHRKPGYDPVELHLDRASGRIPLDATLVKGSHGAPVDSDQRRGVLLSSLSGVLPSTAMADVDVANVILRQFA